MRHQAGTIGLVLLALLTGFGLPSAWGAGKEGPLRAALTPAWTTGIISDGAGLANIIVDDVDQDGLGDVVTCSTGAVYAINRLNDTYDVARFSEGFACGKIAAGDRDGDGLQEIYVAEAGWDRKGDSQQPGQIPVHVLRSDTLEQIDEFDIPGGANVTDIAVGDVDGDSNLEIVTAQSTATRVYNATALALEWEAIDKGGTRLGLGDVDGDLDVEIVVNGTMAHILNARLQTEEFAYAGGFGQDMAVGDVDADGITEIAGLTSTGVYVFEADTMTNKWSVPGSQDVDRVAVGDLDGDGAGEVVTGNGQWGSLIGYAGSDGSHLWTIANPDYAVDGLGLGDTDNDGPAEVVWGAGWGYTGRDALLIGDWQSESVEWNSDDLDGLVAPKAADIDADGQVEIILATSTTDATYKGGTIRVYDGASHQVEWSIVIGNTFERIYAMDVGQVDDDPALEIVLGLNAYYEARIRTYDGATHLLEWESADLTDYGALHLLVSNVDADPVEEIAISLPNRHVLVFDGATPAVIFDSGILSGAVQDMDIGDVDDDSTPELAILTTATLYAFETGTWDLSGYVPFPDALSMTLANADLTGPGEVLILADNPDGGMILRALDGTGYGVLWEWQLADEGPARVRAMEMDGDGDQEFVVIGGTYSMYGPGSSLLFVGSHLDFGTWIEYQSDRNWGDIYDTMIADVDNDTQPELLFGTFRCIQVDEISSSPLVIRTTYLPVILRGQ
jgi:hypothetical protein